MGWRHSLVAISVLAALGSRAIAQEPATFIQLEAPEGCPDARDLARRIERYRGAPLSGLQTLPAIEVTVQRAGGHHAARVVIGGSERAIEGESCEAVFEAAALIVSLALPATLEPPPLSPLLAAPLPAPPSPPPVERATRPAPPRRRGTTPSVRMAAVADWGTLPGLAPGAALELSLARDAFSLAARAAYLPGRREAIEEAGGAELSLATGGLAGCADTGPLVFCAGLEVGWLRGRGVEVSQPMQGGVAWWAATAGAQRSFSLRRGISLFARLEGVLPLVRPVFALDGDIEVHRPAAVTARGSLGLEIDFF